MLSPTSYAAFIKWLEAEMALAEAETKKLRDDRYQEGLCDGELAALEAVRSYFEGRYLDEE